MDESADEVIFVWGCGEDGQLGLPSAPVTSHACTPDWCVPTPTALVLPDGERVGDRRVGRSIESSENEIEIENNTTLWKPIVAGSRNSAAVSKSGALYTWGWNSHDTLGLDTDEEYISLPRKVVWGDEISGTETMGSKKENKATDASSNKEKETKQIVTDSFSLGGWHAVAVTDSNRAFAWGGNEYGQAGVDSSARDERHAGIHVSEHVSVPSAVAFPRVADLSGRTQKTTQDLSVKVVQCACGGMNSFAVLENGSVYQWGALVGSEQEPARVPRLVRGVRSVAAVAAGMFHVIALTNENKVFAWGKGDYGQLGLGRPGNWDAPMEVIGLSGCASGLGDATSGVKVGRGGGATKDDNDDDAKNYRVTFVAAGGWHSCALTESGTCVMWGRGEYGRLGMGDDQTDKQTPTAVDFSFSASDPCSDGNASGTRFRKITDAALGGSHTVFVDTEGTAWTVGRNNHGRLGRVVHGKWTGNPGQVLFPPHSSSKTWRCKTAAAGGRHTIAIAVATTE